jgi:predicted NUDIX family NTP pyrophosphohydrolase
MSKQSAGILLYRFKDNQLQLFLVHPGGPFFAKRDAGTWSIPKGEFTEDEEPLAAARREFTEETGQSIDGEFLALNPIKQKGGKTVYAWAVEGDIDHETIVSNVFTMEFPYKSGRQVTYPEIDKAAWFDIETALTKINTAQADLINDLQTKLQQS